MMKHGLQQNEAKCGARNKATNAVLDAASLLSLASERL
jgi:hypothetical protein